jgi:hypothetical protein
VLTAPCSQYFLGHCPEVVTARDGLHACPCWLLVLQQFPQQPKCAST